MFSLALLNRVLVSLMNFNAVEDAPAIASLVNGAGFVDAFRAANADAPGPTVWPRIEAETPTVFRRVDYVFVLPGMAGSPRVAASRVVLNAPADDARIYFMDRSRPAA